MSHGVKNPVKTADNYVEKFKNLIRMEEAASSSKLREYNLENVRIAINSEDQTFIVVICIFYATLYF